MQLSQEQIQYLFKFTEKKFVHWYDLQIEMVDHLASRIEEEMESDPSLSFESALEKVYKGFGISGFSKLIEEKGTQLSRQARKIWWNEILLLFKWPKITLLALVLYISWQLTTMFDPGLLFVGLAITDILTGVVLAIFHRKSNRLKHKLLLLQIGPGSPPSAFIVYLSFFLVGLTENVDITALEFCIFSAIAILYRIATFQVFYKVKEKAKNLYPDAFA